MRLFVAVNLPAEEKERLYRAAAPLREAVLPVRWVEPESIHLTLKFLGWVFPERFEEVKEAMARAAAGTQPFEARLGGFGAFPSVRRPRVVWAGVEAAPPLRSLHHDLDQAFAELGFEHEARAYHPHLTLGRAVREAKPDDFRNFEALLSELSYESVLRVDRVELMRSHLARKGARYERIASAPLG